MSKNPSFSFYTSDFLTETMFLSFEDKGKLIMLYCLQHQHGHLKKEQMLKACGTISDDIWNFFQVDSEGKYFNEQIDLAIDKREKFVQKQRENGAKKWVKNKSGNNLAYAKSMPNKKFGKGLAMPFENENEYEKEIEKDNEEEKTEKGNKVVREKGKEFVKPTREEVVAYAKEKGLKTDVTVDKWFNFYESNGWKVGRNPMKDWKASYRNWNLNNYDIPKNKSSGNPFLERLKKLEAEEQIVDVGEI